MVPIITIILLSFLKFASVSLSQSPDLNVWPKPTFVSWPIPITAPLSPSFTITLSHPRHRHLSAAALRCRRLLLSEQHRNYGAAVISPTAGPITTLHVSIADAVAALAHGVDESYMLSVSASGGTVSLSARTAWGAMRGLETMSQMASGDPPAVPAGVRIEDRPMFPHRGVLLDTGRNFYPVRDLLRTIRAMAHNKMNVFHWHITDSQSFPIVLPSEPRLAEEGSYGPGMRYTSEDVRRVVHYAMSYGVRVVPEIDVPGHAASWAGAYPEIVTCANKFWLPPVGEALAVEPGPGQLNPLNPMTYKVVNNVIRDVAGLFPDSFYHAGADEVSVGCWKDDPAIRAHLAAGGTLDDVLERFVNATHPYIVSLNRTVVYWEDVITSAAVKVDRSLLSRETTVLQTWNNGPNNTKLLTAAGFKVIVSSAEFYYLDCGHGGWVGNDSRYDQQVSDPPNAPFNYAGGNGGSWCAPFKTWQRVYDYDITHGLTKAESSLVLGGEVALWSEQADAAVLDSKLWPRTAAAAEVLWSGNRDEAGRKRYAEATDRLNRWRYRMVGRGIGAEPIQPLWCLKNPGMCNLVQ